MLEHVWWLRNEIVLANATLNHTFLMNKIFESIAEFSFHLKEEKVRNREEVDEILDTYVPKRWLPHPLNAIKINVDAAWAQAKDVIEILITDYYGRSIYTWVDYKFTSSVEISEAMTLNYAVSFELSIWKVKSSSLLKLYILRGGSIYLLVVKNLCRKLLISLKLLA